MSSCVGNILTKNYQNLMIGFQVTVENVGNVFLDTVYIRKLQLAGVDAYAGVTELMSATELRRFVVQR